MTFDGRNNCILGIDVRIIPLYPCDGGFIKTMEKLCNGKRNT